MHTFVKEEPILKMSFTVNDINYKKTILKVITKTSIATLLNDYYIHSLDF